MYEGFDATKSKDSEAGAKEAKEAKEATDKDKQSSNDSNSVSDLKSMLQKVENLMKPQIQTPDADVPPPATSSESVIASGLTKQPEFHDSVKSQPGTSASFSSENNSLAQGKSYQSLFPSEVHEKHIRQKCPPAVQCPDMRDYIRKDSIPCWACKLK